MTQLRFLLLAACLASLPAHAAEFPGQYNVVWESPSKLPSGQMPLGNGDIAAGVCAIEDGDLYLLLAKNDAYTYNGDLFKTGRVRVSLSPNPFAGGRPFRQTLDLETGSIRIEAGGVLLTVWADANRPVYHVEIDSPEPISVSAAPEFWKRFDDCQFNCSRAPIPEPTQDVRLDRNGRILWYFAVGDRSVFDEEMNYYDVPHLIGRHPDPYRFNTFGNLLECPQLELQDGALTGSGTSFDIRIHALTRQAPDINSWIETIEQQAARPVDVKQDWKAHCRWWSEFWNRSHIIVSDNTLPPADRGMLSGEAPSGQRLDKDAGALVAQSYNAFRFLMACQSRAKVQTKFNGGLFTQPLHSAQKSNRKRRDATQLPDGSWLSHEDDRDWGRRFTYQNQRLLYWPLLMSGDGEMMQPFFDYYWRLLPVRKAITKAWFGHDGAYYRENIEPTGGERDCGRDGKPPKTPPGENKGKGYYHSYYFTSGLETVAMMADYVNFTGDEKFRDTVLVPFAREVLLFFDQHYPRDPDGKLRIDPGMVLETWWIAVNSAPDVSGLQYCLDELLAMNAGSPTDQTNWRRFRAEIPEVHLHEIDGRTAIAPAREWAQKRNSENGLLYPVFPFRKFGLGHGTADIVSWTMAHRTNKDAFNHKCWTQDQIHWAYAGNAAEAQDGLIHRYRHASTECRFPMYGSAGPDSCPDFDHFGSGSTALQRMLVQEANGKILLLPAWPSDWDADFKLCLTGKAVISGTVKDGKLTAWNIQPGARKNDVIVHQPQIIPPRPVIPANTHPLRIGIDHAGGSRFSGKIGRITMFRGLLDADAIKSLAAGDRAKPVQGESVVNCTINPEAGDSLPAKPGDLAGEITIEAWLKPAENEAGRIIDKLTAGQRDGFLIDCHPNRNIRVIVGPDELIAPATLKADTWQHLAVTIGKHDIRIHLNGKEL